MDNINELPKILLGIHSTTTSWRISEVINLLSILRMKNLRDLSTARQLIVLFFVSFPTEMILKDITSTSSWSARHDPVPGGDLEPADRHDE